MGPLFTDGSTDSSCSKSYMGCLKGLQQLTSSSCSFTHCPQGLSQNGITLYIQNIIILLPNIDIEYIKQ